MIDQERIATDREARGFSCDLWIDAPGQQWEDFTHATDEVVIVLEGKMEFEVEGQVHRPSCGDEFHMPAGAVPARNGSDVTARWLYGYRVDELAAPPSLIAICTSSPTTRTG